MSRFACPHAGCGEWAASADVGAKARRNATIPAPAMRQAMPANNPPLDFTLPTTGHAKPRWGEPPRSMGMTVRIVTAA